MEVSSAEGDLNCGRLAQEVSEKSVSMWPRDCAYDILEKNMTAFHPCPRFLPEANLKSFGLIEFAEEILKQPRVDCVVWFINDHTMQTYNEKKKAEKGKLQNVQLEEKGGTRKLNGAKSCVQGDE